MIIKNRLKTVSLSTRWRSTHSTFHRRSHKHLYIYFFFTLFNTNTSVPILFWVGIYTQSNTNIRAISESASWRVGFRIIFLFIILTCRGRRDTRSQSHFKFEKTRRNVNKHSLVLTIRLLPDVCGTSRGLTTLLGKCGKTRFEITLEN